MTRAELKARYPHAKEAFLRLNADDHVPPGLRQREEPAIPAIQTQVMFDLPYPPSANRYWRVFNNKVHVSSEARRYKRAAAEIARRYIRFPFTGEVAIRLFVYRPQKSGDLDNRIKVLCDALAKVAYKNDSQITSIYAERFDDKKNPRVRVVIIPV